MDVIELISTTGAVEPVDPDVLDAALHRLAEAAGHEGASHFTARTRTRRRYPRLLAAAATAAVVVGAGSFAVVNRLDHGSPSASGPAGKARSGAVPGTSAGPSGAMTAGAPTIAAILTAFSASGGDILEVTKTMSGDAGTLGKTIIWISPASPAPGSTVRSRIQQFTLAGAPQHDMTITYRSPATAAPAASGAGCAGIFGRPRTVAPPAPGLPGTITAIDYPGRLWETGAVSVQAATVPSAAALRGCLHQGQWVVLGRGVLHHTTVLELVASGGGERLWVSAATLLPVQLVSSSPETDTVTFTFAFLPPTAANQAMLTSPPVPAGFTQVSIGQGG